MYSDMTSLRIWGCRNWLLAMLDIEVMLGIFGITGAEFSSSVGELCH
jgi:hypothetical protein